LAKSLLDLKGSNSPYRSTFFSAAAAEIALTHPSLSVPEWGKLSVPRAIPCLSLGKSESIAFLESTADGVCFSLNGVVAFGFAAESSFGGDQSAIFRRTNRNVFKSGDSEFSFPESRIRISLFGRECQILLQANGRLVFTQLFAGGLFNPAPFLVYTEKPVQMPPSAIPFPDFLLHSVEDHLPIFSHVLAKDFLHLIPAFNDAKMSATSVQLLPPLESRDVYFEFGTNTPSLKIQVIPGVSVTHFLYEYALEEIGGDEAIGFAVLQDAAFVVRNNRAVDASAFRITIPAIGFTVRFLLPSPAILRFNTGLTAFAFSLAQIERPTCTEQAPVSVPNNLVRLPCHPCNEPVQSSSPRPAFALADDGLSTGSLEPPLYKRRGLVCSIQNAGTNVSAYFDPSADYIAHRLATMTPAPPLRDFSADINRHLCVVRSRSRHSALCGRLTGSATLAEIEFGIAGLFAPGSLEGAVHPEVLRSLSALSEETIADLARRAVAILRDLQPVDLFGPCGVDVPYHFEDCDAVWIQPNAGTASRIVVSDPLGEQVELNVTFRSQLTVSGQAFRVNGSGSDVYSLSAVPVKLEGSAVGFAVQLINYLSESGFGDVFSNEVVSAFVQDILESKPILLTQTVALWIKRLLIRGPSASFIARLRDSVADFPLNIADPELIGQFASLLECARSPDGPKVCGYIPIAAVPKQSPKTTRQIIREALDPFGSEASPESVCAAARLLPVSVSDPCAALQDLRDHLGWQSDGALLARAHYFGLDDLDAFLAKPIGNLSTDAAKLRIATRLPVKFAEQTETLDFFRPCDLTDMTAFYSRLDLLSPVMPSAAFDRRPGMIGSADGATPAGAVPEKMENTLFIDLVPRLGATSPKELRAYSGFGKHLAWLWRSRTVPPFRVAPFVIRFAFGGRLRPFDFEREELSEGEIQARIAPIEYQLKTIRAGVVSIGVDAIADDPGFPFAFGSFSSPE
jgi:hypothetical protein